MGNKIMIKYDRQMKEFSGGLTLTYVREPR
ncbi:uncharacterized protein METZ01_LOCUS429913, partial [marine metagenome]